MRQSIVVAGLCVLALTACKKSESGFQEVKPPTAAARPDVSAEPKSEGANRAAAAAKAPKLEAQNGWTAEKPPNAMRVAQFLLPRADGDTEDASLIVFHFKAMEGGGGGVESNLARWRGQFTTADGKPIDTVKASSVASGGVAIKVFEIAGTFIAETAPGSGVRVNKPGYGMIAAVIETPAGNYFPKLTGPEKTVAKWRDSFMKFLEKTYE